MSIILKSKIVLITLYKFLLFNKLINIIVIKFTYLKLIDSRSYKIDKKLQNNIIIK
jgi:hypothetical protein